MTSSHSSDQHLARLLQFAWIIIACVGAAAYLMAGYDGWIAIFAWAIPALPLFWISHRWLVLRGTSFERSLRQRGALGATLVAVVSLGLGWATRRPDNVFSPAVGYALLIASWLVFAAQLAFVVLTTRAMLRRIRAARSASKPQVT